MEQEVKGINNIDHNPFLSNTQTVAHHPDKFILDFKNIHPQFGPDNKPLQVVNHRIIILDPFTAKEFLDILKENVEKYEEKFGKIEKPKSIAKAERESKKHKKARPESAERPHYTG